MLYETLFDDAEKKNVVDFDKADTVILFDTLNTIFRCAGQKMLSTLTSDGRPTGHIYGFYRQVTSIWKKVGHPGSTSIVFGFDTDTSKNSRKAVLSEYKANRSNDSFERMFSLPRDVIMDDINDLIQHIPHNALIHPDFEFDDLAAAIVKAYPKKKFILISNDKDMWALLGSCNNLVVYGKKGEVSKQNLQEKYGLQDFSKVTLYKILFGDPSDSIPTLLPHIRREFIVNEVINPAKMPNDLFDLLKTASSKKVQSLATADGFLERLNKNTMAVNFLAVPDIVSCLQEFEEGNHDGLSAVFTKYKMSSLMAEMPWF